MKRAATLTKEADPIVLDTLAAAYAETGDFDEAQETVRRAIELAKAQDNPNMALNLSDDLKLYQTGKTWFRPMASTIERLMSLRIDGLDYLRSSA